MRLRLALPAIVLALVLGRALLAPPTAAAPMPSASSVTEMIWQGKTVLVKKGCLNCHGFMSGPGNVGPDMTTILRGRRVPEIFASLWNHLPQMAAKFGGSRRISGMNAGELHTLMRMFLALDYVGEPGDADHGMSILAERRCLGCHELDQTSNSVAPSLADPNLSGSPVGLLVALWRGFPAMSAELRTRRRPWITWYGGDLADLSAAIRTLLPPGTKPRLLSPGDPAAGEGEFTRLGCIGCHHEAGEGDVAPWSARSAAENGAAILNHFQEVRQSAFRAGAGEPSEPDVADLLAFLTWDGQGLSSGDPQRGWQIFQSRNCIQCHRPQAEGGISKPYTELARFTDPYAAAAAMISHGSRMTEAARMKQVPWPRLTPREVLDLVAYLAPGKTSP